MVYDSVGQLGTILYADGTAVTMQYDLLGRQTTMIDSGGTTTYTYTPRSELSGQTLPGGYVLTMQYDTVGNQTTLIDSDGGSFITSFDALNRTSVVAEPTRSLTTVQYDIDSRRTTFIDANGSTSQYQYDAAGQLTTHIELNSADSPVFTMVDVFDPVGNRTSNNLNSVLTTWTYDPGYQVLGQQSSGAYATFQYDAAGNILLKYEQGSSPMSFTYDNANRATTMLQGSALTTYQYSATGNLIQENLNGALTTNLYDKENRLVGIQFSNASLSTYTYSGDGLRRTAFEAGDVQTTLIWQGTDLLGEY
jgi:YD repeat-containing protein